MTCDFCKSDGNSDDCPLNQKATSIAFDGHHVQKPMYCGSGVYGVIFHPCVMSTEDPYLDVSAITKIQASQEDTETEGQINNRVKLFDPDGKFHMRILQYNVTPLSTWLHELNMTKYNPDIHNPRMNQFEYGGLTLEQTCWKKDRTIQSIYSGLVHVLDGLELLHANKIYHMDVKSSNVVNHNGTWKLIDFGISLAFTSERERDDDNRLLVFNESFMLDKFYRIAYVLWPHDLSLLCEPQPPTVEKKDTIDDDIRPSSHIASLFQTNGWTDEYIASIHAELSALPKAELFDLVLPSVDVYSFVIMLFDVGKYMGADNEKLFQYVDANSLVHPDPRKRPTLAKTRELLSNFFVFTCQNN